MAARYLIVNADDFGQSAGVNRGIVAAHEGGIVTSASLMVRGTAAAAAAEYARTHPRLSVGLHVDLGEWAYRNGAWVKVYAVVPTDDAKAVAAEIDRQVVEFRRLAGRDPTHLDSHQHVHRSEPILSALARISADLGVPLRHFHPSVQYCGGFYGQAARGEPYPEGISLDGLLSLLRDLPPGTTELGCHPAAEMDLDSMYGTERVRELEVLCDRQLRPALAVERIELRSFHDAAAVRP